MITVILRFCLKGNACVLFWYLRNAYRDFNHSWIWVKALCQWLSYLYHSVIFLKVFVPCCKFIWSYCVHLKIFIISINEVVFKLRTFFNISFFLLAARVNTICDSPMRLGVRSRNVWGPYDLPTWVLPEVLVCPYCHMVTKWATYRVR